METRVVTPPENRVTSLRRTLLFSSAIGPYHNGGMMVNRHALFRIGIFREAALWMLR